MTPEKREAAIKWLKNEIRSLRLVPKINGCGPENWAEQLEVMETCLEAVRERGIEPLTMEDLRGMDGQPVWLQETNCWALVKKDVFVMLLTFPGGEKCSANDWYKEVGPVYAYHPAHIDRDAWEPCGMCGGKTTLYQHTNTTKLFMNTFGKAATLVTECMACPPYADCCMKGISANSAFKINFCPECGRPLTDAAWAELEKRLRG